MPVSVSVSACVRLLCVIAKASVPLHPPSSRHVYTVVQGPRGPQAVQPQVYGQEDVSQLLCTPPVQ